MPSVAQNLSVYADRTFQIIIPILDVNGNPYNLGGGASANWGMALGETSSVLALRKSTASGGVAITFDGISLYTATVTVVPADTQTIPPANYYHELVVQDAFGDVVNVTTGILTLQGALNQTPLI